MSENNQSDQKKRLPIPAYAAAVLARANAEAEYKRLLASGDYIEQPEAAVVIGIKSGTLMFRTRNIDPHKDYLVDGREPEGKEGEVIVKGSVLRYEHPYDNKRVFLSKKYVDAMKLAEEEHKRLLASGNYVAYFEVDISRSFLDRRSIKIKSENDYLEDGREPKGEQGEATVKGSVIKWQHPYNDQVILLSKKYVARLKQEQLAGRGAKSEKVIDVEKITDEVTAGLDGQEQKRGKGKK